jgi:hypothetical protein
MTDDTNAAHLYRLGQTRALGAFFLLDRMEERGLSADDQVAGLVTKLRIKPHEAVAAREAWIAYDGGKLPYLPEGSGVWSFSLDD